MLKCRLGRIATFWLLTSTSPAVSEVLNCHAELPPVDHAVCTNAQLRRMDADATLRYASVIATMGKDERQQLTGYHDSWLSARSLCGTDLDCLKRVYKTWLMLLNSHAH